MPAAVDGHARIVVVGASVAGVRTVQGLRRKGCADEIVLIAGEPGTADGIAVDRPPLSKGHLGNPDSTAAPLTTAEALAELDVRLVVGRAGGLDLARRRVVVHGGEHIAFGRLVIATGSTPRTVPGLVPGPGIHVLRTAGDAAAIRAAASEGSSVVVVGGGFIGAEVAWTLSRRGCRVTVVEPLPALLVRGLGPVLGAAVTRRHAAAGIGLRLGAAVAAVEGDDRVEAVRLTEGVRIPADLVVLGLGTVPATGWLEAAGLDLRNGVGCDARLAARGTTGVYAVGDLARWHHPRYGEDVRVEHWTNAVETARVVTANLTGTPTEHDAVPYVWSDQLGTRLQAYGRVRPQDEIRLVHGNLEDSFVAITGGGGRLEAVVGLGAGRAVLPYRTLLMSGSSWEEALAVAGGAPTVGR